MSGAYFILIGWETWREQKSCQWDWQPVLKNALCFTHYPLITMLLTWLFKTPFIHALFSMNLIPSEHAGIVSNATFLKNCICTLTRSDSVSTRHNCVPLIGSQMEDYDCACLMSNEINFPTVVAWWNQPEGWLILLWLAFWKRSCGWLFCWVYLDDAFRNSVR